MEDVEGDGFVGVWADDQRGLTEHFGHGVGHGDGFVGFAEHGEVVEIVAEHGDTCGSTLLSKGAYGGGF